ncbi:hypothetical protein RD792_001175 [Penstemon davidsonii]|uniref:DNA-(apurinic or apyrimidinic site) endonuclease 2 n=1 Tax=Penstemon davidsonii TaxID=160366 RepID=A0ABR0DNE5_9LAMI|nr:hypothetical protein RD792_001175 [Penstemon davidsonii]
MKMKIVTYNVNGLRPRVSQFGSLRKLLDSLDADIICFQETKLSRHELRADLVRADGYESFFSCTRTSDKGRTGYSGVATFCRVNSAFSSNEVALPLSGEEGFTGVLENLPRFGSRKDECPSIAEGLEDFSTDELLKIDGEGRCLVTDHGHFVLFNVYGPRAQCDDKERIQFKLKFFNILQRRWESLLGQGRRVVVVGDLNIAPAAIDRCDAGPDFEKNEFRTWFRSLLVGNGGPFFDVFRDKHPDRIQAFTCWSTSSGAEEFNFGSRIDHIIIAGPCLHEEENQGHSLLTCHVKECDILEQFKRWKPGNAPRRKGGKNVKLEGSDHVPVYMSLMEIPNIQEHNTPSLSTRYCPQTLDVSHILYLDVAIIDSRFTFEIRLYLSTRDLFTHVPWLSVSMFARRQPAEEIDSSGECSSISDDSAIVESDNQPIKRPLHTCTQSSSDLMHEVVICKSNDCFKSFSSVVSKKKPRQSQLSLKSFFQKTVGVSNSFCADKKISQEDFSSPCKLNELRGESGENDAAKEEIASVQEGESSQPTENKKNNLAFAEWQRIQQHMQTSIPLCKGHKEPCVSRVVKKAGPNLGRGFYVCARAEGPASNSEANCGFFKWATSKSKHKG